MTSSAMASAILTAVNLVFQFVSLAILARVILTWLPMAGVQVDPYNPIIRLLNQITEPLLNPLRRIATFGMVDFSPIAAIILLELVRRMVQGAVIGTF